MTKVVALETAEDPITCNAICPGYVLTPLVEAQIPDTMKKYGMDRETVCARCCWNASRRNSSRRSNRSAAR
jgi:NAD(P)-dependent dehydrogenase (short-subunit alcohol dehydrogenase family)